MSHREDKKARRLAFFRYTFGWVRVRCVACNGSGYYDHDGSPLCGACDPPGSGGGWCRGKKAMPEGLTVDEARAWIAELERTRLEAGLPRP